MRPHIICHMLTSLDGGLHPSRWTSSPDGERSQWYARYETIHKELNADGWIVGRVTMAEISKAEAHRPSVARRVDRPVHVADNQATSYALALDPNGKLHFKGSDIDGDHVIVLLGNEVPDEHLAELDEDGISYIVSDKSEIDLSELMDRVSQNFPIKRLLLEGGGTINGSFFDAGLVDEVSLMLAPSLEARKGADRVVEFGDVGLAGRCELSLLGMQNLNNGCLHLRYNVTGS